MTPPDLIRADYPTLEEVATTFDDERDRVQRVQETVTHHIEELRGGGWVSDAADGFYREMDNDLLPSLGRLMAALGAAGETIRRIIQIMRQAEQEAAAAMKGSDESVAAPKSLVIPVPVGDLIPSVELFLTYPLHQPAYRTIFVQDTDQTDIIIGNESLVEASLIDARSAVIAAAESGDEAAYAAAMLAYESAIENAFGMSIESDEGLEPTFEALEEYRVAAEMDAAWFEQLWCGDDATCSAEVSRYALYAAATGERVIRRIDVDNLPEGTNPYYLVTTEEDGTQVLGLARGYTSGSIYYDIFGGPTRVEIGPPPANTRTESGERTVDDVMIAANGSHEEGHSFLFSSGLGNMFLSPLQRLLSEEAMQEALGVVEGGLNPAWSEIGPDTRQNPQTTFSELQADTFLFTAQGNFEEFAQFIPAYQSALRQAILRNISPADYYQSVFDTAPPLVVPIAAPEGINSRILPANTSPTTNPNYAVWTGTTENRTYQPTVVLGGDTQGYALPPNTDVTIFGRSETPFATLIPRPNDSAIIDVQPNYWVYGGWYDESTSSYRYGWITSDALGSDVNANIEELPAIPFETVDPARPFESDDVFNPPDDSFTVPQGDSI
jgi:WXG100 family type VII secretion target